MTFFLEKNLGKVLNLVQAMQMASEQAALGLEQTTPNPSVGCVITNQKDELIGVGYHQKYGGAHAEVEAFSSISSNANPNGASCFVTLEPCAHEGKTPSCARMLALKPLSKVVYLIKDPNPMVAGLGHQILKDAEIPTYCVEDILTYKESEGSSDKVIQFILKNKKSLTKLVNQQKYLNRQFLYAMNSKIPYVTLKWAQTLNGVLGLKYKRLMITNEEVQKYVHHLRACHDIILIGRNTLLDDNPLMTNRFGSAKNKKNRIGILDPYLEAFSKKASLDLFKAHEKENIFFIVSEQLDLSKFDLDGYECVKVPFKSESKDQLDLNEMVIKIKEKYKINSLFVEGGAELLSSFIKVNLFNEIYAFSSFKLNMDRRGFKIKDFSLIELIMFNLAKLKVRLFDDNFLIHITK